MNNQFSQRISDIIAYSKEEANRLGILAGKEPFALLQLLGNRLFRAAIGGIERLVVAERTATRTQSAVPVGASHSGIDRYFLNLAAQLALQPRAKFHILHNVKVLLSGINTKLFS